MTQDGGLIKAQQITPALDSWVEHRCFHSRLNSAISIQTGWVIALSCPSLECQCNWNSAQRRGRTTGETFLSVLKVGGKENKDVKDEQFTAVQLGLRDLLWQWVRTEAGRLLRGPSLAPKWAPVLTVRFLSRPAELMCERGGRAESSPSAGRHTLYVYQWARRGDGVIQGDVHLLPCHFLSVFHPLSLHHPRVGTRPRRSPQRLLTSPVSLMWLQQRLWRPALLFTVLAHLDQQTDDERHGSRFSFLCRCCSFCLMWVVLQVCCFFVFQSQNVSRDLISPVLPFLLWRLHL